MESKMHNDQYKQGTSARIRLAILIDDDPTWLLEPWKRAISILKKDYDIIGIWIFPQTLGKLKGIDAKMWYVRVFGLRVAFLLYLFSLKYSLRIIRYGMTSNRWSKLAKEHNIVIFKGRDPNNTDVIQWLHKSRIDVGLISVGYILKPELLRAVRLGFINKHASLLPRCRGIFPFFWAKLTGSDLGISFHCVDELVDNGKVILQFCYKEPESSIPCSMLRFYMDVFQAFPWMIKQAIDRFVAGNIPNQPIESASYFSLPSRKEYVSFHKLGGRIALFRDLFYSPMKMGLDQWDLQR